MVVICVIKTKSRILWILDSSEVCAKSCFNSLVENPKVQLLLTMIKLLLRINLETMNAVE
jgi:hypothetical protein